MDSPISSAKSSYLLQYIKSAEFELKSEWLQEQHNNKSVLVVDDDNDIVNLIKQSLQINGQKVSAFTDPVMALEDFRVNCKTCSVILSDIGMPGTI